VEDNLSVMSIGFLLDSPKSAVIWRGPRKNGIIKQFLTEVDWGTSLDVLVIDTPPGTSDEHLSVATYLSTVSIVLFHFENVYSSHKSINSSLGSLVYGIIWNQSVLI